jgi:hypothetical protein
MSKIYLNQLCKIINDKTGLDASQIYTLSKENLKKEARVEIAIKEILSQSSLDTKELNAFTKSLTKSYFNQINNTPTPAGFVTLSDYVKKKNLEGVIIRESEIKKLLAHLSYMVKNYVTNKSYRLKVAHTKIITYQVRGYKVSKEILKYWKSSFLDKLLKKNNKLFQDCRTYFSYTRPRSNSESKNVIDRSLKILVAENPSLPIVLPIAEDELLTVIKTIKTECKRTKSLVRYIRSHIEYRINNELI